MCPRAEPDYQMGPGGRGPAHPLPAGLATVPQQTPLTRLLSVRNVFPAPTEDLPPFIGAEDTLRGTLSTWSRACQGHVGPKYEKQRADGVQVGKATAT